MRGLVLIVSLDRTPGRRSAGDPGVTDPHAAAAPSIPYPDDMPPKAEVHGPGRVALRVPGRAPDARRRRRSRVAGGDGAARRARGHADLARPGDVPAHPRGRDRGPVARSRSGPSPATRRWRSPGACPRTGVSLCLDVSSEWTDIARRFWAAAGVADRIELRLGPAAETLRALPEEPTFDFAFIDADKKGYPAVLGGGGAAAQARRSRGGGQRLQERRRHPSRAEGEGIRAIRQLNEMVLADARVESVMLAVADGLTLARRLP